MEEVLQTVDNINDVIFDFADGQFDEDEDAIFGIPGQSIEEYISIDLRDKTELVKGLISEIISNLVSDSLALSEICGLPLTESFWQG